MAPLEILEIGKDSGVSNRSRMIQVSDIGIRERANKSSLSIVIWLLPPSVFNADNSRKALEVQATSTEACLAHEFN